MNWFKWFRKPKRIAFLDGDQNIPEMIKLHAKYLKGTETYMVRLKNDKAKEPKVLRNVTGFDRIYIEGRAGKEAVDKFIAGYIQKAVHDGYSEITVVSSDYDFIDIFKMAVMINDKAAKVSFRMIVPIDGRDNELMKNVPARIANIEVIKE